MHKKHNHNHKTDGRIVSKPKISTPRDILDNVYGYDKMIIEEQLVKKLLDSVLRRISRKLKNFNVDVYMFSIELEVHGLFIVIEFKIIINIPYGKVTCVNYGPDPGFNYVSRSDKIMGQIDAVIEASQ